MKSKEDGIYGGNMKVFCWDFDGTLAFSKSLWTGSVFDALKAVEPQIEDNFYHEIQAYMHFGFPWHTPDIDYTFCLGDKWWEFMEKHFCESYMKCGIAPKIAETAAKKVRSIIKQKSRYTLYEDVADALRIISMKTVLVHKGFSEHADYCFDELRLVLSLL